MKKKNEKKWSNMTAQEKIASLQEKLNKFGE